MATTRHLPNYPNNNFGGAPGGSSFPLEPANRMLYSRPVQIPRLDNTNYRYTRPAASFELLKSEQARLETFNGSPVPWPVAFIKPEDCAAAGFFFLADGDKVQCAFCRGVAGEWDPGDIPLVEHKRHFARCPFICNLPVGNIPIGAANTQPRPQSQIPPPTSATQSPQGQDVCGPFETLASDSSHTAYDVAGSGTQSAAQNKVINFAINTGTGPVKKNYVTTEFRLKSFKNWPTSTGQNPKVLAEAGFYYLGPTDHVKCFYCDGGLKNWKKDDDPWAEHARWFQNCPFIRLNYSLNSRTNSDATVIACTNPVPSTSSNPTDKSTSNPQDENRNTCVASGEIPLISITKPVSHGLINVFGISELELKEKEIRELRESRECKICKDNELEVVFLPCGHLVSCVKCATALSTCALCRAPIQAVVRTYLS